MKQLIKIILTMICTLYATTIFSQICIDTLSINFYSITLKNQIIKKYTINNVSEEDYITWVSPKSVNDKSEQVLLHEFFLSRKGDFSFYDLITERIIPQRKSIGFSFIKRIGPGESFSYIISKSNNNSSFYEDRIVIIRKKNVDCFLQGFPIDEDFYYPSSIVLLSESETINN